MASAAGRAPGGPPAQTAAQANTGNNSAPFSFGLPSTNALSAQPNSSTPRLNDTSNDTGPVTGQVNKWLGGTSSKARFEKWKRQSQFQTLAKPFNLASTKIVRRQSTFAPVYGNSWLTVSVGPKNSPTLFTLHQDLASKESAFIEAAFRHEWKESEERVICLPDHDPEHFKLFLLWAYNHAVFSAKQSSEQNEDGVDNEWDRLAGAWALGAYLQAPDFRDAVVDAIIEKSYNSWSSGQSMHEIIYPKSEPNAPIRKLLVDIANSSWDELTLQSQKNDANWSDFFYDLSIAMMTTRRFGNRTGDSPGLKDACVYHEHSLTGSACHKTKYT